MRVGDSEQGPSLEKQQLKVLGPLLPGEQRAAWEAKKKELAKAAVSQPPKHAWNLPTPRPTVAKQPAVPKPAGPHAPPGPGAGRGAGVGKGQSPAHGEGQDRDRGSRSPRGAGGAAAE
eukprot:6439902-Pyramimonas_sp.AAC.1